MNMKLAMIDNYDSFAYNLVHAFRALGAEVTVFRNDCFDLSDLESFDRIVLSPGPGIPSEAGLLLDVIRTYAGQKPILGVCLGEQAIGEYFGGTLVNLDQVFHGVQTPCRILVKDDVLFRNLPAEIPVGRYHSWVVDRRSLPDCLEVLADSSEGQIMALRHRQLDICGLQFHPESVLTPDGMTMLNNWMEG